MSKLTVTTVVLCLLISMRANAQSEREAVRTVQLKPVTSLANRTLVRLRDVATFEGFSTATEQQLQSLDLADWNAEDWAILLTKKRIRLRIALAFPDLTNVNIVGPDEIKVVHSKPEDWEPEMLTELRTELATQWNVDLSAVRVRLLQPLPETFNADQEKAGVDRMSAVLPTSVRPGTIRVTFLSYNGSRMVGPTRVMVEAQRFADVVTAAKFIESGVPISKEDIETRWQAVKSIDAQLAPEDIIGKTLRQSMQRGQPFAHRHLRTSAVNRRVVSARDTVRVMARSGSLTVELTNGIALQSGGIGDRIRIQNPDSKKTLVARVVSATEVQVE